MEENQNVAKVKKRSEYLALWACLGLILLWAIHILPCSGTNALGQGELTPTREVIVGWLQHQESLVRSIECTFDQVESPASPEKVNRLYEVCNKYGLDAEGYVVTQEMADRRTFFINWYREGPKERWDMFRKTEGQSAQLPKVAFRTRAFDGHIARELDWNQEQPMGDIRTLENSHFRAAVAHPFSFLFVFGTTPYSKILTEGTDLNISNVSRKGHVFTQVSVMYEPAGNKSFVLLFDNEHRLVERQLIAHRKSVSGIIEKHTFSDYVQHIDDSGELFWFPNKAEWRYYVGPLPEDPPAEWGRTTLTIKQIKFNIDIPDDKFTFQFPPGTRIWDDVSGFGWIDNIERSQDEGSNKKLYFGRILFEDGDPVFDKSEPKAYERFIFLVGEDRILGKNYAVIDDKGYFEIYLSQEQLQRLQSGKEWFRINIPLDERRAFRRFRREIVFAYDLLSTDKAKAGVARISKPLGRPISLVGKLLPDLKDLKVDLSPADADDKMILFCFFDMEQRPSRNCLRKLSKKAQELKTKDIVVVVVQASKVDENTLNEWVKKYNISFLSGMIEKDEEKTRFNWGVKSLPWLILTDKEQIVRAEGFGLNEIDEKIKTLTEK